MQLLLLIQVLSWAVCAQSQQSILGFLEGAPCVTDAQCGPNQCCQDLGALLGFSFGRGVCRNFGRRGTGACSRGGIGVGERRCRTAAECGPSQCCVNQQGITGGGISGFGVCRPLGGQGSNCAVNSNLGNPFGPVLNCPCRIGLTCQPTGVTAFEGGEQGICTLTGSAPTGRRCRTGADCGPSQCCLNQQGLIGGGLSRFGVCQPLGGQGSSCAVNSHLGNPFGPVLSCPCRVGLSCQPTSLIAVEGGQQGTCVVNRGDPGVSGRRCRTAAECGPFQCCVDTQALTGGGSTGVGVCQPLGQQGSNCAVNSNLGNPFGPTLGCPCRNGLTCQPTDIISFEGGQQGTCVRGRVGPGVSGRRCRTSADCGPFQCCVDTQALTGGGSSGMGVCRRLGQQGSSCAVGSTPGNIPLPPVLSCPCSRGFNCAPTGNIGREVGEQGICVRLTRG